MYSSEDFTMEHIQKHLRIEEETRIHEKWGFENGSTELHGLKEE